MDWLTFLLAFYEADLQFDNDPDHLLFGLYCADADKFCSLAQYFNFAHLLLEDGMQVVLYSIVAGGIMQVVPCPRR